MKMNNTPKGRSNGPLFQTEAGVNVYAPTDPRHSKKKFYRIKWQENGKFRDTTATSKSEAEKKAASISRKLLRASGEKSFLPLEEMAIAYMMPERMNADGWGQKHRDSQTTLFKFIVSLIGEIPCDEIEPDHLAEVLDEASKVSFSKMEHVASALSAFIRWGVNKGWITQNHNALLSTLSEKTTVKEFRRTKKSGESKLHVDSRDIPTHEDVAAYGREAARIGKMWWFELMVNLAAYSGLRLGEEMDLSIESIDLKKRLITVNYQCLDTNKSLSRTTPKWEIVRVTTYPEKTPMGYPLAAELKRRVAELKALDETPKLQDGSKRLLLFPDQNGGWQRQSNFSRRVRRPAQEAAGWEKNADGKFVWRHHSLRHVFCTYYLASTNNNIQAVSIAAGHSSFKTTFDMYIGVTAEHMEQLRQAGESPLPSVRKTTTKSLKNPATGRSASTRNSSKSPKRKGK
jgi:integrase